MKKLMIAASALAMACTAQAGFTWSWWVKDSNADKDLTGCQLGLATENKTMAGAQIGLLWNRTQKLRNGAQVAIGYNNAKTVQNGPQCAIVNIADKAALQFGLLCWNKNGFLPFFVFFNFDKTMFGGGVK